jgi:prepilin peptidase CpaA
MTHLPCILAGIIAIQFALLAYAAWYDVATRIIPDYFSILLALTGVVGQLLINPWKLPMSLTVALIMFLFLLFLHSRHLLGGADVKLLVALSIGLPPIGVVTLIKITALGGGLLAMLHLLLRRLPRPIQQKSGPLLYRVYAVERWRILRGGPLPYGVAIACGGLWAILTNRLGG